MRDRIASWEACGCNLAPNRLSTEDWNQAKRPAWRWRYSRGLQPVNRRNIRAKCDGSSYPVSKAISGVPSSDPIGQGEIGRIVYISEDQDFRTNLGCANGVAENVRIVIDLYDDQGAFLETKTMDLAPLSNQQLNKVVGDYAPTNGYADVRSEIAGAASNCCGSMLDSGSSDPTTVVPVVR